MLMKDHFLIFRHLIEERRVHRGKNRRRFLNLMDSGYFLKKFMQKQKSQGRPNSQLFRKLLSVSKLENQFKTTTFLFSSEPPIFAKNCFVSCFFMSDIMFLHDNIN